MNVLRPDEKSVMTYIAYYFHCFAQLDKGKRKVKKINTVCIPIVHDYSFIALCSYFTKRSKFYKPKAKKINSIYII